MRKAGRGISCPTRAGFNCGGSVGHTGKPNAARRSGRSKPSSRAKRSTHSGGSHRENGTTAPSVRKDTLRAMMNAAVVVVVVGPAPRSRNVCASDESTGSRDATAALPPRRLDNPGGRAAVREQENLPPLAAVRRTGAWQQAEERRPELGPLRESRTQSTKPRPPLGWPLS